MCVLGNDTDNFCCCRSSKNVQHAQLWPDSEHRFMSLAAVCEIKQLNVGARQMFSHSWFFSLFLSFAQLTKSMMSNITFIIAPKLSCLFRMSHGSCFFQRFKHNSAFANSILKDLESWILRAYFHCYNAVLLTRGLRFTQSQLLSTCVCSWSSTAWIFNMIGVSKEKALIWKDWLFFNLHGSTPGAMPSFSDHFIWVRVMLTLKLKWCLMFSELLCSLRLMNIILY